MTVTIQGRECVRGCDVSRWQGGINYGVFDLDFVIYKATGGDAGLYTDGMFHANADGYGTAEAPYHFASEARYDPVIEANYFCDVILASSWARMPHSRRLPPVLDWEPQHPVKNADAWVIRFCQQVTQRTGLTPVIYTGAYVSLDRTQALLGYDLWLAAYTPQPIPCAPWGLNWSLWQYSSTGSVSGIKGGCDTDVATVEWFNRVLTGAPVPQPTPGPEPTIEGADVQTIIAIETKAGHYVYEPVIGTGRVLSPEESQLLQDNGWKVRTYPAGSFAHVVLNEKVNKLNYTEVG